MDWSAPNAGFILAAYLVSAAALLGLVLSVVIRARCLRGRVEKGHPKANASKEP